MAELDTPVVKCFQENPLFTPKDVPFPAEAVPNAGVVKFRGKYIMLFQARISNGQSVIGLAESEDGIHFQARPEPVLTPSQHEPFARWEEMGVEAPRICFLYGEYLVTYHACSQQGVKVILAKTTDFGHIEREGAITRPGETDVVVFPGRFGGRFFRLACSGEKNIPSSLRVAWSSDLMQWHDEEVIIKPNPGHWDELMIAPGAPPIRTERGWLNIFNGAGKTEAGTVFRLGVALHDIDDPAKVLGVAEDWILESEDSREVNGSGRKGFFACGAAVEDDDIVKVYWAGGDKGICGGEARIKDLTELCREKPRSPL